MRHLSWFIAAVVIASGLIAHDASAQGTPAMPAAEATAPASASASIGQVQGKVDALGEQVSVMQSDLDKLKRVKVSGYVQARYEASEQSLEQVTVSGSGADQKIKAPNTNRFYIRRGRLKVTYDSSPLSQAVVYFDAGSDRVISLLEAYVTLRDPWTVNHDHMLNVGQMNVPFGYELERSSSVRELPERSKAENVLFPGERDRGVTLTDQWLPQLQTVIGIFNGGGIKHVDFPNSDPTQGKDLIARARWSQGVFDLAASAYSGKNLIPLTGESKETRKTRFGVDAQYYYSLPTLGGGSLKGEFYTGHEVNPDSVKVLAPGRTLAAGESANHLATDFSGWYAMWVQNLGERAQVAARYDVFDPNRDVPHDQYRRANLGVSYFYDGNTRITAAYEIPRTDRKLAGVSPVKYEDPQDNIWTIQVQHKF